MKIANLLSNISSFKVVTPELEYWMGFALGDFSIDKSSNRSPRLSVGLNAKDYAHILKFKNFIGSPNKISIYTSFDGRLKKPSVGCSFRVTNEELVGIFESAGVAVSLNRKAAPYLIKSRHWARGLVDADGSLNIKTQKYGLVPRLGLCGSKELMNQFYTFVLNLGVKTKVKVLKFGKIYTFQLTGTAAYNVIKYLYREGDVALNRKMYIARAILNQFRSKYDSVG